MLASFLGTCLSITSTVAQDKEPPFAKERAEGVNQSIYRNQVPAPEVSNEVPKANTKEFHSRIKPLLSEACFQCHGPNKQKGKFRLDTLDPDLINGADADWWLEVVEVLSNHEMPPEDEDVELADEGRSQILDWLTKEIQVASQVRRSEKGHSSFRRMTSYEYNYALQDLLGLPYNFADDLLPETSSEDGFKNSSEMLHISVKQFEAYRLLARQALQKATVRGDRPETIYYSIPMEGDLEQMRELSTQSDKKKKGYKQLRTFFKDLETGEEFPGRFNYRRGIMSHHPVVVKPDVPPISSKVLVIPANKEHKIDLGVGLPDTGTLRVRIRAARTSLVDDHPPELRLKFGFQPTNDSRISKRVDNRDVAISASPDQPQFYQWEIPLSEITRNNYRGVTEIHEVPTPTEYLIFKNSNPSHRDGPESDIQIDYIEVTTPLYDQWPPESHSRIFINSAHQQNESIYAREILSQFLPRAWRRPVKDSEIDRQLSLFTKLRPTCNDFQETMIEVLATALASPKFLYLVQEGVQSDNVTALSNDELATRLSIFLWCSTPDQELLDIAKQGKLNDSNILTQQVERMLVDPRSQRFSDHFVRQWLGMQLLDHLIVEKENYPKFDNALKEAMQEEPIAFFREMLKNNSSVLDFLHADYTLVNERLAQHYGLKNIYGNQFRKVALNPNHHRGGLMTQAGLLAMNSDGKDSHPLKRGVWLLERILNDPPPPPPAAVPEIDLADPEIAKLTLKERIENHRNDPACMSCHSKIDPWGIAFENYDAVGAWRDEIGDTPIDASSYLFNNHKLEGMDGLKRYLLINRQDQFCRALVYKLSTFALGRPLSFSDLSLLQSSPAIFFKPSKTFCS